MALNFTEDKLIACLETKQRYKGVHPYIQQACKFNEQIYTVINGAILHTLLGKQSKSMTRLLALRFFKELLLTGNFTMIDSLDQKIEDYILEIAQYNSKVKQSRGANYFIDIHKAKPDEQTQRLGISYVILATEIIGVLAKIYQTDENGDQTRFVKYYKRLNKLGISLDFNKCNYFKKEDVDTFDKNYQKWIQWCQEHYQQEEQVELKDQNSKGLSVIAQSSGIQKPQQKQEMVSIKDLALLKSKPSQKSAVPANGLNINQAEAMNQSAVGPFANLNFSATNEMNLLTNTIKGKPSFQEEKNVLQNEINTHKKNFQTLQKEKKQMEQKYIDQLKQIKNKNKQYIGQIQSLKDKLSNSISTVMKLQTQLKQKQTQLQLKNQCDSQPQKSKRDKNTMETECYNILISPPRNIDILEEENDVLKEALEQCEKSNDHSQQLLKNENNKLLNLLKQKQQQIQSLKKQTHHNIEKQIIQHLINEDSLVITDEIKVEKLLSNNGTQQQWLKKQENNKIVSQPKYDRRDMSQKKQTVNERPRSLKKTESQRRINKNTNYQVNITNTSVQFYTKHTNPNTNAKLQKTAQQFSRGIQQNPKFVTTFPYLDDYFPKLPEQSYKFKNSCLLVSDLSTKIFYENTSLRASLKILDSQRYIITILNKTKTQQKIKLIPPNESILDGQKTKKISSCVTAQFQITTNSVNLNLRFPIISVLVNHSRISAATSNPQIYQIPLPITLLNYCSFKKISEPYRHFQSKTLKYITNRFLLNKNYKNIQECFLFLNFNYEQRDLVYRGIVEFNPLNNTQLILQLRESSGDVTITTEFQQFSSNACNLAKVLIQVIMYLIKTD